MTADERKLLERLAGEGKVFLHRRQQRRIQIASAMVELFGEAQALSFCEIGIVADLEIRGGFQNGLVVGARDERQRGERQEETGRENSHRRY